MEVKANFFSLEPEAQQAHLYYIHKLVNPGHSGATFSLHKGKPGCIAK
jgi:hypothetical protein